MSAISQRAVFNNLLLNTSPLIYGPQVQGVQVRHYYDSYQATAAVDSSGSTVAFGPPMQQGGVIMAGILQWAALGASTQILGVGDSFVSNRFKLAQQTSSASCSTNSSFDGKDVGGIWGNVGQLGGAWAPGADSFPNPNADGTFDCAKQLLVIIAGTGAPAGRIVCRWTVAEPRG